MSSRIQITEVAPSFEELQVGSEISPVTKEVTRVQIFMFSAVTWNRHRIHYDNDFAQAHDKLPSVLAQRPLLGSFLAEMLFNWVGEKGKIRRIEWSNRGPAVPGDILTCRGRIVKKYVASSEHLVELEVWIENQKGESIVPGKAEIVLNL
jgi:hydroxyacyl-ACP dehydratase HTD2-like protein with hotdog domain